MSADPSAAVAGDDPAPSDSSMVAEKKVDPDEEFFKSQLFELTSQVSKSGRWNLPFAELRAVVEWGRKQSKFYPILYDSFDKLHNDSAGNEWSQKVLENIFEETEAALELLCDLLLLGHEHPAREEVLQLLAIMFNLNTRYSRQVFSYGTAAVGGGETGDFANPAKLQHAQGLYHIYSYQSRMINTFGNRGCFAKISEEFNLLKSQGKLTASMVIGHVAVFKSIGKCLSKQCLTDYICPWIELGLELSKQLEGKALTEATRYFVENDEALTDFTMAITDTFSYGAGAAQEEIDELGGNFILGMILKMVKADNYNGVMHSLNVL
jgi:hypothetical protein